MLPLRREGSNKLRGLRAFLEVNEQSTIMFKKFKTGCQNLRFLKRLHVLHLRIYFLGVWSKAHKCLVCKWLDQLA